MTIESFMSVEAVSTVEAPPMSPIVQAQQQQQSATSEDDDPQSPSCPLGRLWLCKLGYFACFFGYPTLGAFASVLYQSKGFSPLTIGLLCALQPICTLVVLPAVSYLAETRDAQQFFIFAGVGMSTLMLFFIIMAPPHSWVVVVGAVALNVYFAPVVPLWDEHTMSVLGSHRRDLWGSIRSFGAYGWGVSSFLTSLLFGQLGWVYVLLPWVGGFATLLMCVSQTPVKRQSGTHQFSEVVAFVRGDDLVLLWCFGMATMGTGYSIIATFLFVYLTELGAPSELLGLCLVSTVSVEIPLFMCSEWLHNHFTDGQLFIGAVGGWIVRAVGYSLLTNPWYVLLLEPLHGLSFGLMWLAGVHAFTTLFPKALANSAFGILNASTFGLGPLLGNVVGGLLFDAVGPRSMFRIGACGMALLGSIFFVAESSAARRRAATRIPCGCV